MNEENRIKERYDLTIERINLILEEESVAALYLDYFRTVSRFILNIDEICKSGNISSVKGKDLEELETINRKLYQDVLDEAYDKSYANPAYAVAVFGKEIGEILSFLYAEIHAEIAYAYENKIECLAICNELFIEIYNSFEETEIPNYRSLKEIIYWYASDYCDVFLAQRLEEKMNPQESDAIEIIKNSDLEDLRYLYKYGEYISSEDYKTVEMINSLSEEEVDDISNAYIDGYREGCEDIGIELAEKQSVYIQYQIGTERIVREVIKGFENLGLQATTCRNAVSIVTRENEKNGFYSKVQLQYKTDHMYDQGLFLNKKYVERKLDVVKNVYEQQKNMTAAFAGCVLIGMDENQKEVVPKQEAIRLTEKQESLQSVYDSKMEELTNKYLLKELNIAVVDITDKH